ncbi:MAG TPA: deoxyribose-phosphate aldolase, partial [Cellulomonas sp.]|nr:deoxyribose-phosphate aldolase [Cellulomonas sp.]
MLPDHGAADPHTPTPDADDVLAALARHIDVSCVQAHHDLDDITALARDARAGDFVSAHVLPNWLPRLRELLDGSNTLAGSPVSFPSGGARTTVKVLEAQDLLAAGAQELDVVVAIGRLRSGDQAYVERELAEVVAAVDGRVPLRAILEVGHLSDDEIRRGVDAALAAGIPWVKTGTGWSGIPTTVHHIEVIAERVQGRAGI